MCEVILFLEPCTLRTADSKNELIQDAYGTIAEIHKSLLTDNHIQAENGTIKVSPDLYATLFGGFYKRPLTAPELLLKKFIDNIDLILNMKEVIFSEASLFMAKLPFSYWSAKFFGPVYLTLGELLKVWESNTLDSQCANCRKALKLFKLGDFISDGYCFNCRRVISLKTDRLSTDLLSSILKSRETLDDTKPFSFAETIAILKYQKDKTCICLKK